MERICPFLATSDDGRTVVDGFDRAHVCRAEGGREPVDRSQQLGYCLGANHVGCERFADALERRGPISWPAPSPDAVILQTRLVVPAVIGRHALGVTGLTPRSRRWLLGGAVTTIGVAAVATGVAGSMGGLVGGSPSISIAGPSSTLEPSGTPAAVASQAGTSSPLPTLPPTPASTPSPQATEPPPPTAAPTPEPQTYLVQPGDTLSSIAGRFGTTVQAVAAANGIDVNAILNVGQVLIIP